MLRASEAGDLDGDGDATESGNVLDAQAQPEADVGVRNMSASHRTGLAKIKNVVGMHNLPIVAAHRAASRQCGFSMLAAINDGFCLS